MESGNQGLSLSAGGGAGTGLLIVSLPVAGYGPADTVSMLSHTFAISALIVVSVVLAIIALRVLLLARSR